MIRSSVNVKSPKIVQGPKDVPMPEILNVIIGKEINVMIEITEANVKDDSNIYETVDLCDSSYVASSSQADNSPLSNSPSFNHANVSIDKVYKLHLVQF